MEIYTVIANWSGWPAIVAFLIVVGSLGSWFFRKHIDILQDQIKSLERSLRDERNFRPDIVTNRLIERHKAQTEAIELLQNDKEKNRDEIQQQQAKLSQINLEFQKLDKELEIARNLLEEFLPRSGNISIKTLKHFNSSIELYSAITVSVQMATDYLMSIDVQELNKLGPFRLRNGISNYDERLYLYIVNSDGQEIGVIQNPFSDVSIRDEDYNSSLALLFSSKIIDEKAIFPTYQLPQGSAIGFSEQRLFEGTECSGYFIKIPFTMNEYQNIPEVKLHLGL